MHDLILLLIGGGIAAFVFCLAGGVILYVSWATVKDRVDKADAAAEEFLDDLQGTFANADIWETLSEDGAPVRGLNLTIDSRMGLWMEMEKNVFMPVGADMPEMWGVPPQQEDVDRG